MGAHHSLRLPLSLHLQGADVSGISDVQNPPQPSHPRKSLEPAETMPRPDEPAKRACCKFMDSVEAICKKRLSSAWGGHKPKDDDSKETSAASLRLLWDRENCPKVKARPRPAPPPNSGVAGAKRKNSRFLGAGVKRKPVRLEAASKSSAPWRGCVNSAASTDMCLFQFVCNYWSI